MNESELAVICCLLGDLQGMGDAYVLEPYMFKSPVLGKIFGEMKACYDAGEPADVVTLRNRVADDEATRDGFMSAVKQAACMGVLPVEVKHYVKVVASEYKARRLEDIIYGMRANPAEIDSQITTLISELDGLGQGAKETQTGKDLVDAYAGDLFTPNRKVGIKLGYEELDGLLQGLDGGNMVIIAARPSVGKSALVAEISLNVARSGKRVGIYSLEMTNEDLYERMLAHESGISIQRIRKAQSMLTGEDRMIDEGNQSIRSMPIVLCDHMRKVSQIQNNARREKLDMVVIDYAQLLEPESYYRGNRTAEVGQISHSVKWMAKRLDIPVILLAQLNRTSESTKEPTMGELRESGDFEQDADKIILLWNKDDTRTVKGVKVDKNRQGEVGKVEMRFDGAVMRFVETDGWEDDDGDNPFK